jgi:hypothetical protein
VSKTRVLSKAPFCWETLHGRLNHCLSTGLSLKQTKKTINVKSRRSFPSLESEGVLQHVHDRVSLFLRMTTRANVGLPGINKHFTTATLFLRPGFRPGLCHSSNDLDALFQWTKTILIVCLLHTTRPELITMSSPSPSPSSQSIDRQDSEGSRGPPRFSRVVRDRPDDFMSGGIQHSFRERPPAPIKLSSGNNSFKDNPFLKNNNKR